jgi:hypothetical protein
VAARARAGYGEILELIDLIFEKCALADVAQRQPDEHQERRSRHNGVQAPCDDAVSGRRRTTSLPGRGALRIEYG